MLGRFWMGDEFPSPPTETTRNSPTHTHGSRRKGCPISRNQKCPLAGLASQMHAISQRLVLKHRKLRLD